VAREVFEAGMHGDDQLDRLREDVVVSAADLLRVPQGTRTDEGLRLNVRVGLQYLEAWLGGNGCVPLYHLMEDAATAEISRAQIWQWLAHGAELADGGRVSRERVERTLREELAQLGRGRFAEASELFAELCFADDLDEFLTLRAYDRLETPHA
jgi:malate synthase